jgi:hypothetical protein
MDTTTLKSECANHQKTIKQLLVDIASLRADISALKVQQRPSPAPASAPQRPGAILLDSLIVREFPANILCELQTKRFVLLWRGTRDGFHASTFHGRCDGHSNTLTIIEGVGGYIFGGFTPISWDTSGSYKTDHSNRSFLFTLRNPAGTGPMKFALIRPEYALQCFASCGPTFGAAPDIYVADQSDANMNSHTYLGNSYVNYTGHASNVVFTGAQQFRAKEIEVFEIVG